VSARSPATASTASVVVAATVPSATSLDPSGCASGSPGRTSFGIVQPGASVVTGFDCVVEFGSSNDAARLRIAQSDRLGAAMWKATQGTLDASFDGDDVATATGAGAGWDQAFAVTASFCTARLLATGAPDTTFGGDGTVSTDLTATMDLRFGLRTAPTQPPGRYSAPITFDVVAP